MKSEFVSNMVINSLITTKETNPIFTEAADIAIRQQQLRTRAFLPIEIKTPNKKKLENITKSINDTKKAIMETESALYTIQRGLSKATNRDDIDFANRAYLRTQEKLKSYKEKLSSLEQQLLTLNKKK